MEVLFFLIDLMGRGGGTNICQTFCWVSLCNANLICYGTQMPGGTGFFFIQIFFFLRSTLKNYCKHFPKSICREFISPVGYFINFSEELTRVGFTSKPWKYIDSGVVFYNKYILVSFNTTFNTFQLQMFPNADFRHCHFLNDPLSLCIFI